MEGGALLLRAEHEGASAAYRRESADEAVLVRRGGGGRLAGPERLGEVHGIKEPMAVSGGGRGRRGGGGARGGSELGRGANCWRGGGRLLGRRLLLSGRRPRGPRRVLRPDSHPLSHGEARAEEKEREIAGSRGEERPQTMGRIAERRFLQQPFFHAVRHAARCRESCAVRCGSERQTRVDERMPGNRRRSNVGDKKIGGSSGSPCVTMTEALW